MDNKLIKIFEKVRDEPLNNPEKLGDKDNRCWGKHRRLKELLEKEGYQVRFRVCSFRWSSQRFPKDILKMPHKDNDYHLFLEMKINGKWIVLDCSNDKNLPEFNTWDGFKDCKIAVNYDMVLSTEESLKMEEDEKKDFLSLLNENKDFYIAINKFFNLLRKKLRS